MAVCYLFLWLAHKVTALLVKVATAVDLVVVTVAVATVEATEVEIVAVATVEALVVTTAVATSSTRHTNKKLRSNPEFFVFYPSIAVQ